MLDASGGKVNPATRKMSNGSDGTWHHDKHPGIAIVP
jgi:hypothetical protein